MRTEESSQNDAPQSVEQSDQATVMLVYLHFDVKRETSSGKACLTFLKSAKSEGQGKLWINGMGTEQTKFQPT
jgi:hypothetical protein